MIVGATAAVWVTLKAQGVFRKRVERSRPDQLLKRAQLRVESLRESVKDATFEGIASARVELDRLNQN